MSLVVLMEYLRVHLKADMLADLLAYSSVAVKVVEKVDMLDLLMAEKMVVLRAVM